jgi:hypothetical protein
MPISSQRTTRLLNRRKAGDARYAVISMKDMTCLRTLSARYATTDRMTSNMCLVYRYRRRKVSFVRYAVTLNRMMVRNYRLIMSARCAITDVTTSNQPRDRRNY